MLHSAACALREGPGIVGYVLMFALLWLVCAILTGCTAAGNTPYGSFDLRTPTIFEKSTKTRTTQASGATDETVCEGGVCRVPPR
jgi:hypothetical protein